MRVFCFMKIFRFHYVSPLFPVWSGCKFQEATLTSSGVVVSHGVTRCWEMISKEKDGPTAQFPPLSEFILWDTTGSRSSEVTKMPCQ